MNMIKRRSADVIFSGGTLITMEGPIEAQRMDLALADGRILAMGDWGQLSDLEGPETNIIDV